MKKALVGYTGFVGSNIYAAGDFEGRMNPFNKFSSCNESLN